MYHELECAGTHSGGGILVETLLLETLNSPRERGKTLSALHHGTGWCQWVPLKIGFATSKMSWFIMVHHHFPHFSHADLAGAERVPGGAPGRAAGSLGALGTMQFTGYTSYISWLYGDISQ